MIHFHPLNPEAPPTVDGEFATGLIRIDVSSIGGDIQEYEITPLQAMQFGQRLMDSAAAMLTFIATKPRKAH